MSKEKKQSPVKAARKAAKKELELNIINNLKEVVATLGYGSKKTTKEIEKTSKKLATKLAELIRIDKTVAAEVKKAEVKESTEKATPAEESKSSFSSPEPIPAPKVESAQAPAQEIKKPVISTEKKPETPSFQPKPQEEPVK